MRVLSLILAFTSAFTFSCGGASTEDPEAARAMVVESYNRFGFNIFREEIKTSEKENPFISPVSISFALAMTAGGSSGETEDAMYSALELTDIKESDVRIGSRALYRELTSKNEKLTLTLANSIWLRKGIEFNDNFIESTEEFFFAEGYPITTPKVINSWVENNTGGKIKRIINSISPDDIAFLINAVYFKGIWQKEFDPDKTEVKNFHPDGKETVKVDMMRRKGKYRYLKADSFEAVSIPYGEGEMSACFFLPNRNYSLSQFNGSIDFERWDSLSAGFSEREGTVELPRIRIEYKSVLNPSLKALGMGIAFSPTDADFSGMCQIEGENVFISEVLHKTFLKINEEGTEAAAVTSVRMKATSVSMDKPQPFHLVFDRPFFMMIKDEGSGTILFMGNITDPPAAGSVE